MTTLSSMIEAFDVSTLADDELSKAAAAFLAAKNKVAEAKKAKILAAREAIDDEYEAAVAALDADYDTRKAAVKATFDARYAAAGMMKRGSPTGPRGSVAAKFRDPVTGNEWSGRGLRAKWLQDKIDAGASLTDYLITPAVQTAA